MPQDCDIGCSKRAVYVAVDDFNDAVNMAPELDIHLPQSPEGWSALNSEWTQKSSYEIFAGCVGALDGFFWQTNKPTKKET